MRKGELDLVLTEDWLFSGIFVHFTVYPVCLECTMAEQADHPDDACRSYKLSVSLPPQYMS